jgi:hypothetical protein
MDTIQLAWAEAQSRYDSGWRPARLLGDNTKLSKAEKFGKRTLGLSLAPAEVSGYEVCASRSDACTQHCIFTSGRGVMFPVMWPRIFRNIWFFKDRGGFLDQLFKEVRANQDASIRLNVFSDWMWERQRHREHRSIMEAFPNVQFYDYTKHFKRMFRPRPENYHLTFSLHEGNGHQAQQVLDAGMNVAAVVSSLEGNLFGYPVFDGDEHDLRFMDPHPAVVGLKAKGSLKTSLEREMIYDPTFERA